MPYIEKRIKSGDILEVERYFSPRCDNRKRCEKSEASSMEQQKANRARSEKELWRMVHANFSGKRGDLFSTFTFREAVDEKTAIREWKNFIRRATRYALAHNKAPIRYLYTAAKAGQWHIHAIMTGIPLQDLTKLWGKGRVTASILEDTNDYRDLAAYFYKQTKAAAGTGTEERRKYSRSWSGSRNLKRPEVEIKEIKRESIMKLQPKAPKGYILLPNWEIGCTEWGDLYQRFICKRIPAQADRTGTESGAKKRRVHIADYKSGIKTA